MDLIVRCFFLAPSPHSSPLHKGLKSFFRIVTLAFAGAHDIAKKRHLRDPSKLKISCIFLGNGLGANEVLPVAIPQYLNPVRD